MYPIPTFYSSSSRRTTLLFIYDLIYRRRYSKLDGMGQMGVYNVLWQMMTSRHYRIIALSHRASDVTQASFAKRRAREVNSVYYPYIMLYHDLSCAVGAS